jgi:N-acetylmuramic acid 6-phosphate etherase
MDHQIVSGSASMTRLRDLATEQSNPNSAQLDQLPLEQLLRVINREDATIAGAVAKAIPQVARATREIAARLKKEGRLFYIGAGTSGRLGCLDASEMPPTYGVSPQLVQGIIAGGTKALTRSQEGAEDDAKAGIADIRKRKIGKRDALVGLSVSGRARYVREALNEARRRGAFTACITCNANSLLIPCADVAIVAQTGAEVITGSTRMKAGTAQKMILNMISTAAMVQLGRVKGNRMLDLQIKCEKLQERALNLVIEETRVSAATALKALKRSKGSVRDAVAALRKR